MSTSRPSDKIKRKMPGNDLFFQKVLPQWRENREKIVFTNGCFDLLHAGHINNLSRASELGDKLIVGLNSDQSVRELKGPSRPVQKEKDRQLILASLFFVDLVLIFEDETPTRLIENITPHVLVKGGDYPINEVEGGDHVIRNGGNVVLLPLIPGRSTSSLIS